ncbi:MAG: DUF2961 domain-containing protein [Chthonomonadales bacterium]
MNFEAAGLHALAQMLPGRSRRISSNEQPNWHDGNFDMTRLEPGEVLRMPRLEGPGFIHHIWMTSHSGTMDELDGLTLRIWWDDRIRPGVEVPLGHFSATGSRPAVVESIPVQVSASGSLTCYWRMPSLHAARIEVANENPFRSTGLYWQVDWVQLECLPAADVRLGEVRLSAAEHMLALRYSGPSNKGVHLFVERLRVLHLPPEVDRPARTHNEAHFIRLGVGRAVYAFRLAHHRLPHSLEELAASGIMSPRYLRDENLIPLASRCEPDAFVVWSTAPSGWEARFRGLDARR